MNSYNEKLIHLTQKRRQYIIYKSSQHSETASQSSKGNSQSATQDKKKSQCSQSSQQGKNIFYQEKPKFLFVGEFANQNKDYTYIKNIINNNISQVADLYPQINSQLMHIRTPFQNQKYNEKMGVFLQNLLEHIKDNQSKIHSEICKELFFNPRTNSQYENFNLTALDYDSFFNNQLRKQIFCLGEIFDDVTDSMFQNSFFVFDNYNQNHFNPAVLSVSYSHMKCLDKGLSVVELPKVSFIQLGLNEQKMNKNFLYFNPIDKKNQKKEILTNVQYISIFHSNQTNIKHKFPENNDLNSDHSQQDNLGSYEQNQLFPNCVEIIMNAYLEEKKAQNDNQSLDDEFFQNNKKCPKIFGSSEFFYLFEQAMKLIRHHKPKVILFAYDFSLTRAHNHYYDLKPDVLGYFCYMLSQISNQHVIFIVNTKYQNHFINKQFNYNGKQYYGLDGYQNLYNYLSLDQIKKQNLNSFKFSDEKIVQKEQKIDEEKSEDENKYKAIQNQRLFAQIQVVVDQMAKNSKQKNQSISYLPETQVSFNNSNENNLNELLEQIIPKLYKYYAETYTQSEPSKFNQYFLSYIKEKFNALTDMNSNESLAEQLETKYALDFLLNSKFLYEQIQNQFYSVFFGLLEMINYRKIIQKYSIKAGYNIDYAFMLSLTDQIRKQNIPQIEQLSKGQQKRYDKQLQQYKIKDHMTKLKQIKHVVDFVFYSNKNKVNLFMEKSQQKYYSEIPKISELSQFNLQPSKEDVILANQNSMIINVLQDYLNEEDCEKTKYSKEKSDSFYSATLVDGISKQTCDKMYSDQLKVKIMLKRYTQALLNNWVFDLRRNKKIYLNIQANQQSIDGEFKFFFTERCQYIVDYIQDDQNRIVIYFFNIKRGKIFKNYVLTEVRENFFQQQEMMNESLLVYDLYWKSFIGLKNINEIQLNLENHYKQYQSDNQDSLPQLQFHIHEEKLENLEIFNSTICIAENFIFRMFGEIINPYSWKQKEFSIMIFSVKRKFCPDNFQENPILKLNNLLEDVQISLLKSIPRSGCTSVSILNNNSNEIYVFGGVSYNGFICNVVEEFLVTEKGNLILINQRFKQFSQNIYRPLFSPFTFLYNKTIYFFGGEFGKKYVQRGFNSAYIQSYNIEEKQFKIVQTLNIKDINKSLHLKGMEAKKHQELSLQHFLNIPFYSTNHNQYNEDEVFKFAQIGKVNSSIEQILEKTTVIYINIDSLVKILTSNLKQTNYKSDQELMKKQPSPQPESQIEIITTLEDEKLQELRLCDYNSSKTFFISIFQADQSTYIQQNQQNQQKEQQANQTNQANNPNQKSQIIISINEQQNATSGNRDSQNQNSGPIECQQKYQSSSPNKQVQNQMILNQQQMQFEQKLISQQVNQNKQSEVQKEKTPQLNQDSINQQKDASIVSYLNCIKKELYYTNDNKIFIPKYILCQNQLKKQINIVCGESTTNQGQLKLNQRFQITIRLNDEDFNNQLLDNSQHFLTFNSIGDRYNFYKTLSLEECNELMQIHKQNISFNSLLYKTQIKHEQQKCSILQFSQFGDEYFELKNPTLVNRYITCDQQCIYLLNGTDYNESYNQYNRSSPCERIFLRDKCVEAIPECFFLDSKKSQIISNENYIFYLGMYENHNEGLENGDEDTEEIQQEYLIAQIFIKSKLQWKVIKIDINNDLTKNFSNYQIILGNCDNRIFAVNGKCMKNKKEALLILELTFDLDSSTVCIKTDYLKYDWQGKGQTQIIPSLYYSGTIYTALPTNPITYKATSLINFFQN